MRFLACFRMPLMNTSTTKILRIITQVTVSHLHIALCFSCDLSFLSCLSKKGFPWVGPIPKASVQSKKAPQLPQGVARCRKMSWCRDERRDREIWRFDFFFKRLDSILGDSETGSAPYSRSTVSLPSKSVPVDRGSGYRVWGPGWCTRNPYVSIHFLLCILPVAVHHHYLGTRIRLGNETGRLTEWMMSMTIPMVHAKSKKTQGGDCSARISATEKVFCARVAMPANYCQLYFGRVLWRCFASWLEVKRSFVVFFPKISMICVWPFQQLQGLVAKLL